LQIPLFLAIAFIKLSHTLLRDKGKFSFIIPKSFSFSSNYKAIREFLFDEIDSVVDCSKVWNEVKLEQVIINFSKTVRKDSYRTLERKNQDIHQIGEIEKKYITQFGFYLNGVSDLDLNIAQEILDNCCYLNEISTNKRGGTLQRLLNQEQNDTKVLGGANIQREGIIGFKGYINKELIKDDCKSQIKSDSVLVQNIVSHIEKPVKHIKITSCVPNSINYAILDTINQISINDNKYSSIFISALLNSKIVNWYAYRFIYGKAIRTMHFDNVVTDKVPVPKINHKDRLKVEELMLKIEDINSRIVIKNKTFTDYTSELFTNNSESKKLVQWHHYKLKQILNEINKIREAQNIEKLSPQEEYKITSIYKLAYDEYVQLKTDKEVVERTMEIEFFQLFQMSDDKIEQVLSEMP